MARRGILLFTALALTAWLVSAAPPKEATVTLNITGMT